MIFVVDTLRNELYTYLTGGLEEAIRAQIRHLKARGGTDPKEYFGAYVYFFHSDSDLSDTDEFSIILETALHSRASLFLALLDEFGESGLQKLLIEKRSV